MPLPLIPVVLTFDEAPNIARVLSRLTWASCVLVVDSGSTDGTQEIAKQFDNVRVIEHAFVDFQSHWNFAVAQARAQADWILALDADYVLSDEFIDAVRALPHSPDVAAYRASFVYCLNGRELRGSLYPPKAVLFHADRAHHIQQGHKEVLQVDGSIGELSGRIFHDDRKSQARWLKSQWRYACEEAALINGVSWRHLSWSSRVRTLLLPAAPLAFAISLFGRAGIFDGWSGLFYAMQRAVAELLIAIALIERRLPGSRDDKR